MSTFFSTFVELMLVVNIGKNIRPLVSKRVLVNDCAFSYCVTRWRGKNCEWSKIISTEHYTKRLDRADFTIVMCQL